MHARPRIRVTTQPRGQQRLNKPILIYGALALLALGLLVFLWWKSQRSKGPRAKGPRERPVAEYVVTEKLTPMRPDLRLPKDYSKLPLEETPAPAPAAPPAATPGQPTKPAPVAPGKWGQPRPPLPPPSLPPPPGAPPMVVPPPLVAQGRTSVALAKVPDDPRSGRWFGGKPAIQGNVLSAPLPAEAADTQASKLFPKAVWERPKEPTKVLYAHQLINVLLLQNVNSDMPGIVRLEVTQDVVDQWGLGHVLLPKGTIMLASMEGQAKYGQQRIPLPVYLANLPNGSSIQFQKTQVGDAMGASGLPANVNNHYGSLLLGVGIQAFMNIGTRAVAGSTTGFNPTLEQEFAQDIARSANRTANQFAQRELQRSPTLEQEFGFPATIQFTENISFQSQPTLVSK